MDDFDPESVKTGSGQVIYITGDDADFYSLAQQVNLFPSESYLNRTKKALHDLGVPEVAYGTAGGDSGRSKAIDYQSLVDVIQDKRNAWELAIGEICEHIQILGYIYFKADFFENPETKAFEPRPVELDWSDVVPLTSSEKITNVINKYNGGIISLDTAIKELGYKDIDQEIEKMRQEEQDPELAAIRHKVVQLIPGIQEATINQAQAQQQAMMGVSPGVGPEQGAPTLTAGQNGPETALPMAQPGNNTSFSSAKGFIERTKQNLNEAGKR
jgi:hypothetical protein